MATTARVIPFKRPALPDGHADYSYLVRYAYRAAQAHCCEQQAEAHLDESAARLALGLLADLKQRLEELERKLSA